MNKTASCSCERLKVTVEGEPIRLSMCHCLACQKRTGTVFGTQARFPSDKVHIEGLSKVYMRVGDEGGKINFHFCPDCGSTVYYQFHGHDEFTVIPTGAFADPTFPAPKIAVYMTRKHPWVNLPADMECYD